MENSIAAQFTQQVRLVQIVNQAEIVQVDQVHSYACPLEQYKLVCACELNQPVKIDCAICAGQPFLKVLPCDEIVKPPRYLSTHT